MFNFHLLTGGSMLQSMENHGENYQQKLEPTIDFLGGQDGQRLLGTSVYSVCQPNSAVGFFSGCPNFWGREISLNQRPPSDLCSVMPGWDGLLKVYQYWLRPHVHPRLHPTSGWASCRRKCHGTAIDLDRNWDDPAPKDCMRVNGSPNLEPGPMDSNGFEWPLWSRRHGPCRPCEVSLVQRNRDLEMLSSRGRVEDVGWLLAEIWGCFGCFEQIFAFDDQTWKQYLEWVPPTTHGL